MTSDVKDQFGCAGGDDPEARAHAVDAVGSAQHSGFAFQFEGAFFRMDIRVIAARGAVTGGELPFVGEDDIVAPAKLDGRGFDEVQGALCAF